MRSGRLNNGTKAEKNTAPRVVTTAKPEKNKVVGDPTRTPVNRQAAMLVQPMRSWIYQPLPPAKEPNPFRQEVDEAKAALKTERNEHAVTRDMLGQTRQRLKEAAASRGLSPGRWPRQRKDHRPVGGFEIVTAVERVASKWQCTLEEAEHKINRTMAILVLNRGEAIAFLDAVLVEIVRMPQPSPADPKAQGSKPAEPA